MGTHPSYRHRGAARLLIEWGEAKATALNLEIFFEAGTSEGRHLYQRMGYSLVKILTLDENAMEELIGDECRRLGYELGPVRIGYIWKLAGGKVDEGAVMPWDLEPDFA